MSLHADQLVLGYNKCPIVCSTSLHIEAEKITCLIGPNGCGKSTLLRGLSGLLSPFSGHVTLDGIPLNRWDPLSKARRIAVLSQNPTAPDDISVLQLIQHGRFPHQGAFKTASKQDHEAVEWALKITGMEALRHRIFNTLSGGERQRGWIALALAQQAEILLVDEPTTYLDLGRQLEIMDLLYHLNQRYKTTIVMVLHDINQACRFAHRILAMQQGQIIADGKPHEIMTPALLEQLFGIKTEVLIRHGEGGEYPFSIPLHSTNLRFATD